MAVGPCGYGEEADEKGKNNVKMTTAMHAIITILMVMIIVVTLTGI